MDYRYYLKRLWFKILYSVVVVIYLVRLDELNKQLIRYNFKSPIALLSYNDGVATMFFGYAVFFFCVGGLLEYLEYRWIRYKADGARDIIVSVCTMVVLGVLLILIIVFIDNPILKAVLMFVATIVGVIGALTS